MEKGVIVGKSSPYSFTIQTNQGLWRRHLDQILQDHTETDDADVLVEGKVSTSATMPYMEGNEQVMCPSPIQDEQNESVCTSPDNTISNTPTSTPGSISNSPTQVIPESASVKSRPTRVCKAPKRLITET